MKRLALLGIVGLLAGLVWGGVVLAHGSGCAVTVDAAVDPTGSIQAAVDGASPGDHICLKGTFAGEPTVTIATSGITIRAGSEAVLDGGTGPAFSFAVGVSYVNIGGAGDTEPRRRGSFVDYPRGRGDRGDSRGDLPHQHSEQLHTR